MKKNCLICLLFAFLGITVIPSFGMDSAVACRSLQKIALDNLNNIKNCSRSSYGIDPGYLFKGIENGQCHYSKINFSRGRGLEMNTLAECYAPISVIQNFAIDNIRSMQDMCDENGISGDGYMSKQDETTLERYCR